MIFEFLLYKLAYSKQMDANTWIIQQLERGTANGWWTAVYAEQMIRNSGILTRTKAKTRTRSTETAIQWITKAMTYGVAEGWYSQHDLKIKLWDAIGYSFPSAAPSTALSGLFGSPAPPPARPVGAPTPLDPQVPPGNIDMGINWRWLNA